MVITLTEGLVLIKMKNETVTLYSPGNKNPIVIAAHLHSRELSTCPLASFQPSDMYSIFLCRDKNSTCFSPLFFLQRSAHLR